MTELKQLKILIAPKEKEQLERFAQLNHLSVNQTLNGLIREYNQRQSEIFILELHKRGLLKLEKDNV